MKAAPMFTRPRLFVILVVLWLLLTSSVSPGHILLGVVLAGCIVWVTRRFWPQSRERTFKTRWFSFFIHVLWDLIVANVVLARMVLFTPNKLQPGFIVIPLDVTDELAIAALSNVISLAPGTVTADLNVAERTLVVHVLHLEDEAAVVKQIKERYEDALREIFEC